MASFLRKLIPSREGKEKHLFVLQLEHASGIPDGVAACRVTLVDKQKDARISSPPATCRRIISIVRTGSSAQVHEAEWEPPNNTINFRASLKRSTRLSSSSEGGAEAAEWAPKVH